MAKTIANLKNAIMATMNRTRDTFNVNGLNNVAVAINNAKDYCQRAINFEYAKQTVTVKAVSLTNGGSLDTAVLFSDQTTAVNVKLARRAYFSFVDGTGQVPVKILSRDAWAARRLRMAQDLTSLRLQEAKDKLNSVEYAVVLDGKNIFIDPPDSNQFNGLSVVDVHFDVLTWLPDFITSTQADADLADTTPSFLFDYCFDLLMYRSIYELNFFLKEDQRVALSQKVLDDTWNNVVQWNATIVGNSVDVSLD